MPTVVAAQLTDAPQVGPVQVQCTLGRARGLEVFEKLEQKLSSVSGQRMAWVVVMPVGNKGFKAIVAHPGGKIS